MTEPRRGITLEYAKEKRRCLLNELMSDDHYAKTETLTYGSHDPFSIPVPNCDTCGSKGQMQKVPGEKIKWKVVCLGCHKTIHAPQKRPWQAALMWCDINLGSLSYKDLPLFGLSKLSEPVAKKRMQGIRRNLELRKNIAGLERTIANKQNKRPPGREYQQKLEAYLKWSMLALRLIKYTVTARNQSGDNHL